jgi:hypothetical protein
MVKNLNWLKKEVEKDRTEIKEYKKKVIKEILSISKEEIISGPKNIQKPKKNLWKKILTNAKNLLRY